MKIRPLGDRIMVKPLPAESVSEGGIIIPDNAKESPNIGTIVAAGGVIHCECGKARDALVQVGDKVMYGKYGGTEIEVNGEKLLMMGEPDILGIVEDD